MKWKGRAFIRINVWNIFVLSVYSAGLIKVAMLCTNSQVWQLIRISNYSLFSWLHGWCIPHVCYHMMRSCKDRSYDRFLQNTYDQDDLHSSTYYANMRLTLHYIFQRGRGIILCRDRVIYHGQFCKLRSLPNRKTPSDVPPHRCYYHYSIILSSKTPLFIPC